MEAILDVEGLAKRFGGVAALDGVSLSVVRGEIRALIGPNGSGKTTLLRVVGGAVRQDAGVVRVEGRDVSDFTPRGRALLGVVRTMPRTVVAGDLPIRDHVVAGMTIRRRYAGALRAMLGTPLARAESARSRARAQEVLSLFGLDDLAETPVETLPGTERRLVAIATAVAAEPRVLLLDEPSAGMSPAEARHLAAVLADLRAREMTLIVVEHNMRIVRLIADVVTVLDAGRVIAEGTPDAVAREPAVVEAYLGPRGL